MVFKNFIHYLVNKYLKNYIERFDHEKVKLNLKSGNIFLENLHLKPEALAYLNIPATVAVGYLEQLKVTIPWNQLSTNPTEVYIDGLYLLIVPKNEMSQDLTEHRTEKSKRVQKKLENLRKAAYDNGALDDKEVAFLERMRFQVMQNLVVKIRNLHISYEMKSSSKLGHPFSFGMTIHSLELTTATNVKRMRRLKANSLLIYKIKEMNSISIYWNTKCKSRLNMSFKDVVDDLKSKIATKNYIPNEMEMKYILRPINLISESIVTLKLKERYFERSSMTFDVQVPHMSLHLDSEQISDVLDFFKLQNYTTIYDRCREYRGLISQESLGIEPLTQEQKQRIQLLETKLDIFQLAYIRYQIELENTRFLPMMETNEMDQEQQLRTSQISSNTSVQNTSTDKHHLRWDSLSKMKNSLINLAKNHRTTTTTTNSQQNERKSLFEDVAKIDVEINFDKVDLNLLAPPVNFGMNDDIIACISISDARVDVKKMSLSSQIECLIGLQSVQVFGMYRDKEYRPIILTPILSSPSPLVHIDLELFSATQRSDYRFHLFIEPIQIIYDAPTINRLVECFQANDRHKWPPEPEIIQRTRNEMEQNVSEMKIYDMLINLKGASILLPEYGILQQGFSMIRIHFGNMILKSCPEDIDWTIDNRLFQENVQDQRFYGKYKFELSDLRIVYSTSNNKRLHILRRTPLIDIDFYKCIYSDDANLTKWRIGVRIAMGDIQLSQTLLTKLIFHFKSVPLLYLNLAFIIDRVNFYFILFAPYVTLTIDLSIYNSCLRLLRHPQMSTRTDFHIYLTKTRDEDGSNTSAVITLNEPTMIQHIVYASKQSSQLFYRDEYLKLFYSNSYTKL